MWKLTIGIALVAWSVPASALCIYHGEDNAKTTIGEEFKASRWVVRARVISADYHWSDEGESWTSYRMKVVRSYKGKLSRFTFLTERNSGGFYMDGPSGGPDFDHDYLLFLTPDGWPQAGRPSAKGALWVNYNCGQSKVWSEVTQRQKAELAALSQSR